MKFESDGDRGAKIKVIGIGGAGGNAVNNMIHAGLRGVEFVTANTDIQDLDRSICVSKIQLGSSITKGLGAGADPEIGRAAAEENLGEIREFVTGADMVFLAAGMGGGTGTGATPVIARECKEGGALTIAVVTKPFLFEGEKRMMRALAGIDRLRKEADTLILISNERLRTIGKKNSTFRELITRADDVLLNAVKGISDLIVSSGFINLDFADVKKVMGQMGTAVMGIGRAGGENRALNAARQAITSPLLEDISISGAKSLLMNICGPSSITMEEMDEASSFIKGEVDKEAEIFWGVVFDENMGEDVQVTVIATGIEKEHLKKAEPSQNLIRDEAHETWPFSGPNEENPEVLETPAYQRQRVRRRVAPSQRPQEPVHQRKRPNTPKRSVFKETLDHLLS